MIMPASDYVIAVTIHVIKNFIIGDSKRIGNYTEGGFNIYHGYHLIN